MRILHLKLSINHNDLLNVPSHEFVGTDVEHHFKLDG